LEHHEISDKLKEFIYSYIDSVEQLEVLLFLWTRSDTWHSFEEIGNDLRLNPTSVGNRLRKFNEQGLIEKAEDSERFLFKSGSPVENIISELSEHYRIRKHRVFELIFSPSKKARVFADAFGVKKTDGGTNG
jgi:hypothetical protein